VLAIFAHPDDESLVAGGTLAACVAAGLDVFLICATRGEQGTIASPDLATPRTLGAVREAELRTAATTLGLCEVEFLGYPDGELARVDAPEIESALADRIRYFQPEAIITFGPDGLYGHRDHIAVHHFSLAALDAVEDALCTWLYYATWPEGQMQTLVAAAAERGLPTEIWGLRPEDFGVSSSSITTAVDVSSFLAPKLEALRGHHSQVGPDHLLFGLPNDLTQEFLGTEYFIRARPPEAARDWLTQVVSHAQPESRAHQAVGRK
jgi:N-acetyl-1-D-myo-inositol-2-amino-2-deoxy-alpha-D-glucopyranoside deacetylase